MLDTATETLKRRRCAGYSGFVMQRNGCGIRCGIPWTGHKGCMGKFPAVGTVRTDGSKRLIVGLARGRKSRYLVRRIKWSGYHTDTTTLPPRMMLAMQILQPRLRHMGINLGGGQVAMPEQQGGSR